MNVRRAWGIGATLVAMMVTTAGCGVLGGADDGDGAAGGGNVVAPDDAGLPPPVTRPVGKTGWWGGFQITVDEATAEGVSDVFGELVRVTAAVTMQNLGEDSADPPFEVWFDAGGATFPGFTDSPTVGGGGTAPASITADITPADLGLDGIGDLNQVLDALAVVYGEAGDNQTRIPLGSAPAESFEPRDLTVAGDARHGPFAVTVTGASLRPSYEPGEGGRYELALEFELACDGCPGTGLNVDRGSLELTSPAGATVTADIRSPWCCAAVYENETLAEPNQIVVYVVTEPVAGAYELMVTADFVGDPDDDTQQPLEFELELGG
jgi:hypothetical protein